MDVKGDSWSYLAGEEPLLPYDFLAPYSKAPRVSKHTYIFTIDTSDSHALFYKFELSIIKLGQIIFSLM
jgi:hypothetical protein